MRVTRLLRSNAMGAIVAQVWQAVGSFGLQIVAAWVLGAAGLGVLSLCLGVIVLCTAVASGIVGDSLVVLDRHDRGLRGGLQIWTLILAGAGSLGSGTLMWVNGVLTPWQALLFGLALSAFLIEEIVRRIFMAIVSFWKLVIIDSSAVLVSLGIIAAGAAAGRVSLGLFFLGMVIGQLVGIAVGLAMLPVAERALVGLREAQIKAVAGFGLWRGAQVAVSPLLLTVARVMVTVFVGKVALGQVEAARIYAAPALLAVQGFGSYLLSSYVRDKARGLPVLLRRANRASAAMVVAALVLGAGLTLLAPSLTRFVTGPSFSTDQVAVAGWALVVAATASFQPVASLAAVNGRQSLVLACRLADLTFSVAVLALLLGPLHMTASYTPYALATGLTLGGVLVRLVALRPLLQQEHVVSGRLNQRNVHATA